MKTKNEQALTKLLRAGVTIGAPLSFLRGKNLKGKGWIYSFMSVRTNGKSAEPYCTLDGIEVDPFTVTAWTGKYDKNMQAVFAGDFVKFDYGINDVDGEKRTGEIVYLVHWNDEISGYAIGGEFGGDEWGGMEDVPEFEVVGNVFDDPDLAEPFLNSWEKLRGENV